MRPDDAHVSKEPETGRPVTGPPDGLTIGPEHPNARTPLTKERADPCFHLIDRGSGPPVVFLHGNPDSSELWREIIDALCRRFRCLAPDLPGFGRSAWPEGFSGSLEDMAAWVSHVVDETVPQDRVCLAAHDFGAIFGMAWAIRYPDRVERIAVGGFPFFPDYRWHFWARVWRTPIVGELSLLAMNRWLFSREMRAGGPKLTRGHIDTAYRQLTPKVKRAILRLYRATDPENFGPWQPGLQRLLSEKPALVLWGDKDPFVPAAFASRLRGARVVRFPDCGHWFPAEEPEAVAALLEEFFAGLEMPTEIHA